MINITKIFLVLAVLALAACVTDNEPEAPDPIDYFFYTGTTAVGDSLLQAEVGTDSIWSSWIFLDTKTMTRPLDSCNYTAMVGRSRDSLTFDGTSEALLPANPGNLYMLKFQFPRDSAFTHYSVEVDCRG